MLVKSNEAMLTYKNYSFMVYQSLTGDWCFSFEDLKDVHTGTRELQIALNSIYESIDERVSYQAGVALKARNPNPQKPAIVKNRKNQNVKVHK